VTAAIVAGLLAGYGIAIPVGAIGAYLVALSARTSPRVGVAAALGVATVDGMYALVVMLGGATLARLITPLANVLRWPATAVLLLVAIRITLAAIRRYRTPPEPQSQPPEPASTTPPRAYAALLAMPLLNPTTIIYFTAVVLGGQATTANTWPERSSFVLAAFLASATWQLLLATAGTLLGRTLTGPRAQVATALTSSAVIVILAIRTALT
jgi:arginine exporter protein ArgO